MANAALQIVKNRGVNIDASESATCPAPLKPLEGCHIPKGLAEIRAMRGDKRHTAEHVYNSVLSKQERDLVCYAAGVKPLQQKDNFAEYDTPTRLKFHKAILQLQELVKAFVDANAIAPAKFVQNAPRENANTDYSHLTVHSH
ncbi:hypothetical protein [Pseudoalteromonas sp. bablab_jr011]|uniref:hypothetical protein n=1 Tax=Pseudoalteromonas sp. bablab_jr011 TaxID=2755062 RepID=UPI0018F708CA|nr:hypothetical protein [Pseudoalteromonas sp. bablab_jr011]